MADARMKVQSPADRFVVSEETRARARQAFEASVQTMIAEKRPLAALGELDDLEMMEAATELTRER